MADQTETASQARSLPVALQAFVQEHPFAVWGGLWSSVVVIAGFALVGLFSAGPDPILPKASPSPVEAVAPSSDGESAAQDSRSDRNSTPIWVYLAIAGGCAVGSLLLFRSLVHFSRHRSSKRPKDLASRRRKAQNLSRSFKPSKQPFPQNGRRSDAEMTPMAMQPEPMMAEPMLMQDPVVTIVPQEEDHPLDWGENNLAEIMDIRKRYSLSSLLRQ